MGNYDDAEYEYECTPTLRHFRRWFENWDQKVIIRSKTGEETSLYFGTLQDIPEHLLTQELASIESTGETSVLILKIRY